MATESSYLVKSSAKAAEFPQVMQCHVDMNKWFFSKLADIKVWIAGGALRDYFSTGNITESDVDFFASSRTELCKLVLKLRKSFKFKPYLITKKAIKGDGYLGTTKIQIDVVKVLFADMQECIDKFDFTCTCFAISSDDFVFHPSAPFDLMRKRLVINSLPFPLSTMQRLQKYLKRGYWICNGGMLEIAKAIKEIDFSDPEQNNIELYPDGSPRFVRFD
jgi:hypothetical protein